MKKDTAGLINLYSSMLQAAGCSIDSGFCVSTEAAGTSTPLTVDGKRIVLPTHDHLQNAMNSNTLKFHPLNENIMRSEPALVARYRALLNNKLSMTLAVVTSQLLTIAASVAEHKKLSPDQSEFLSLLTNVDDTTVTNFSKYLIGLAKAKDNTFFTNVFLKKGGSIDKKKYSQVAVITFPAYEEICGADNKTSVHGVKFRTKDLESIKTLFEYILPGIDEPNSYTVGTNSDVAPRMHALMLSFGKVASKLNAVLELFGKKIEGGDALIFNSDWVEAFDNLSDWLPAIRSIPMQDGNEGGVRAGGAAPVYVAPPVGTTVQAVQPVVASVPVAAPSAPVYTAPVYSAPVQQPVPVQSIEAPKAINFGSLLGGVMPQLQQVQQMQAFPVANFLAAQVGNSQLAINAMSRAIPTQVMQPGYPQQYPQTYQVPYGQPMMQQPMYQQPMLHPGSPVPVYGNSY